jgi:hypothetical protein
MHTRVQSVFIYLSRTAKVIVFMCGRNFEAPSSSLAKQPHPSFSVCWRRLWPRNKESD